MTKQHEPQKMDVENVWSIFGYIECIQNGKPRMEQNAHMMKSWVWNVSYIFEVRFIIDIIHSPF